MAAGLMGRWPDIVTEALAYGLAFAFAVMLVVGPQLIAEDEPAARSVAGAAYSGTAGGADAASGAAPTAAEAGKAVFTANCGSCHTLAAAGTSGAVGPPLDDVVIDVPTIANTVREGRGSMPAFGDSLATADIAAVAAFVAGAGAP